MMRTTKRFTPKVLARFKRQGRGTGTHADYLPWHRVSRGDPASRGRSHLLMWRGRLRELLSDGELNLMLFATMLPYLDDALEQFVLPTVSAEHPLRAYCPFAPAGLFAGTVELAASLRIKHPQLSGDGITEFWSATTDQFLVFRPPVGPRYGVAIAYKTADWKLKHRTVELLRLEREFWVRRGVPWLLITPAEYDERVALSLRRTACWGLGEEAPPELRRVAVALRLRDERLTKVLDTISAVTKGTQEAAQRALWQAVWRGELPIDLRRGWRPHHPLTRLTRQEFLDLNPIFSRRSAWTT